MKNIFPIAVRTNHCTMPPYLSEQLQWIELRHLFMEKRLERFLKMMNAQITLQSFVIDIQFEDYQPTLHLFSQMEQGLSHFEEALQTHIRQIDWQDFIHSFEVDMPQEQKLEVWKTVMVVLKKFISGYLKVEEKGAFIPTNFAYFTTRQDEGKDYYCFGFEMHLFDQLEYMHYSHNEFFLHAFKEFYKEIANEYTHLIEKDSEYTATDEHIEFLMEQSEVSMSELLRHHGEKRVLKALQTTLGQMERRTFFKRDIVDTLNMISSLTYESDTVRGQILFCHAKDVEKYMEFSEPIPLEKVRRVRKLLQTATSRIYLLCDGKYIYGLTQDHYKPEQAVEIVFKHTLFWQVNLYTAGNRETLLQMNNSIPQIVVLRVNEQRVKEAYEQIFHMPMSKNMKLTIRQAKKQEKGTMLVITNKAVEEAERLHEQSFSITNHQMLNRKFVESLTMVDGALLLNPESDCYAFGVILDGVAGETGDITRGARYNAAIKYLSLFKALYQDGACLIVVISEDNLVDVLGTV